MRADGHGHVSVSCREGFFPETGLPVYGLLGNWASGTDYSRKPGFRCREFSETQFVVLVILGNPICRANPLRRGLGLRTNARTTFRCMGFSETNFRCCRFSETNRPYVDSTYCFYLRTTKTGQWACRTTESETLPIKALLIPPNPRLPTTTSPTPNSSARSTTSAAGLPVLKYTSATVPPTARTFSTSASST